MAPLVRSYLKTDIPQIKNIFWECATVDQALVDKDNFFHRWCGEYLINKYCGCFVIEINQSVVGYMVYCLNSIKFLDKHRLESHLLFQGHFYDFPAHLHINIAKNYQGKGLGKELIESFNHFLNDQSLPGVFIITGANESNVQFYTRLGFNTQIEVSYNEQKIMFMGRQVN